jgi:hypothetical protein
MIILGLLLLAGGGVAGTMGVLRNLGAGHHLLGGFSVFGHTMHPSAGQLFLWGIVVGGATMLGLVLLLVGLRGGVRRSGAVRRDSLRRKKEKHQAQASSDQVTV